MMAGSLCLLLAYLLGCMAFLLAFLLYFAKKECHYLEERAARLAQELAECNEKREAECLSALARDLVFPGMVVKEE